jgi:hypothetical protein
MTGNDVPGYRLDGLGSASWRAGRGPEPQGMGERSWDPEVAARFYENRFYENVLGEAAGIAGRSVSRGFEESRRKTMGEFQDFVGLLGHGKRLENATGLDVVAFVHGFWISMHKEQ